MRFKANPLFITLALFIFIAAFIQSQFSTITPLPITAPESVFSSERAFNMLERLTKEQVPHPVDSAANRIVEQRIVGLLKNIGYHAEIQQTQICRDSKRGFARCAQVRNIIVKIQGTSSNNNGILLAAHYDSVPAGPGGSDAGAAVGTLLETARLLTLEKQPLNTIVLLFNEGEEFGLFGAQAFMEQHPLAKELTLALNVEARGSTGKSVMFETGENSGWLVKHYADTTPAPISSSLFYEVYKALPNDTDLTVFKEHGLQGLNFAHAERLAHYHTPLDNISNLDKGSLQHHGDNVWGVLKIIKDQDLNNTAQGNLVFSDILGLFVISWQETTSLWLSSICLVLFITTLVITRKKHQHNIEQTFSIQQPIKSFFSLLIILTISTLAAYIILISVRFISGYHAPWHANSLPMQFAVWFSVLTLSLLTGKILVKNLTVKSTINAVSFLWIILSLATSIWLTGISFLFIIPAFASLMGQIVFSQLSDKSHNARSSVLIMTAVISAIIFMPIAYIIIIMLGYGLSVAIGFVLGLIAVSTLPILVLNQYDKKSFNQLIIFSALITVLSLSWTALQSPHSSWLPQRLNINYVENDQGKAFISYGYQRALIPDSLTSSFEKAPQLSQLLPWSNKRSYVAEVDAQIGNITKNQKPVLNIIETKRNGDNYSVTAKIITDSKDLSDIKLYIPVVSGLTNIEARKQNISYLDEKSIRNGFYEYHCRGVSCANIELTMHFSNYKAGKFYVSSAYPGLPSSLVHHINARGNTSVPAHIGDQSIRYNSFEF